MLFVLQSHGLPESQFADLMTWHPMCIPEKCNDAEGKHFEILKIAVNLEESDTPDMVHQGVRDWVEAKIGIVPTSVRTLDINPNSQVFTSTVDKVLAEKPNEDHPDGFFSTEPHSVEEAINDIATGNYVSAIIEVEFHVAFQMQPWRWALTARRMGHDVEFATGNTFDSTTI
jgi:hypothetical protein